jgi:hypothetical protein
LGFVLPFAERVFYLLTMICDGYLSIKSNNNRFFEIACKLPVDLQMVLCNRLYHSPRDIIPYTNASFVFKNLFASFEKEAFERIKGYRK